MASITREEVEQIMADNLKRISELVDARVDESLHLASTKENVEFQQFRTGYKVYNATTLPVLARGTEILLDLRPAGQSSGMVACYKSLGDRYVEAWVKII